jgi:hypothetical protein
MQTNSGFTKTIRKHPGEQMNNKPKSKTNKIKRIISKKEWQ